MSWSLLAQSLSKTESGRAPSQHVGQQSEIRKVMDFLPLEVWVRDFNKKKKKKSPSGQIALDSEYACLPESRALLSSFRGSRDTRFLSALVGDDGVP